MIHDLRNFVINPTLKKISLWTQARENILVMTICNETMGQSLVQKDGPALGIYQIEPATYKSLLDTLSHPDNKLLKISMLSACYSVVYLPEDALIWNLKWATCMAALVYHRHEEPLPEADNIVQLAEYYKKYYNSNKGKADVEKAEENYLKYGAA